MTPVGAVARVRAAAKAAPAAGNMRRVAMACSTPHQVSRLPSTTTPSLRRPEAIGSQNARKTAAPVTIAHCDVRMARPRRGSSTRLRMNQLTSPITNDGMRIHTPVADTADQCARKS